MEEINEFIHDLLAGIEAGRKDTCGLKIQFLLEQDAADFAAACLTRPGWHHQHQYPCVWCGFWHVGRPLKAKNIRFLSERRIDGKETNQSQPAGDGV